MNPTSQRDRAVRLLRSGTSWLTAGAVAGTGLLSVGVAVSLPGRSTSASASATASGSVLSPTSGVSSSGASATGSATCPPVASSGSSSLPAGLIPGSVSDGSSSFFGGHRRDDGESGARHDDFAGGEGQGFDSAFVRGVAPTGSGATRAGGSNVVLSACVSGQGAQTSQPSASQSPSPQVAAPQPAVSPPIVSSGGS